MPSRNIIKEYAPDAYYHIYSRGVNKDDIFLDEDDYTVFISLFKRYLSSKPTSSPTRHHYQNYRDRIKLLSYALMPNHFHLMLFQKDETAITEFMRSLITSYVMYFNKKYKRQGPLFQSKFKASRIGDDAYLYHISRYIHLNPKDWRTSNKTSLDYYTKKRDSSWVDPSPVLELFDSIESYLEFLADYESQKELFDEIKWDINETDH